MDLTKVHTRRRKEGGRKEGGGGGERRAPNKAGPMRPPLLNGIKFECIGTIGTFYGHNKSSYSEEEEEEKDGPLIRLAL